MMDEDEISPELLEELLGEPLELDEEEDSNDDEKEEMP